MIIGIRFNAKNARKEVLRLSGEGGLTDTFEFVCEKLDGIRFFFDNDQRYLKDINDFTVEKAWDSPQTTLKALVSRISCVARFFAACGYSYSACVSVHHFRKYRRAMRKIGQEKIAARTVKLRAIAWHQFLTWRAKRGDIPALPYGISDMCRAGLPEPKVFPLTLEQYRAFISALTCVRDEAGAKTMAGTGVRVTELGKLTLKQIPSLNSADGPLLIQGIDGKGGWVRDVWITRKSAEAVWRYIDGARADSVEVLRDDVRAGRVDIHMTHLEQAVTNEGSDVLEEREDAPLWLTERGLPLAVKRWAKIFAKASEVASKDPASAFHVHPHRLRHTYAVVELLRLIERHFKWAIAVKKIGANVGEELLFFHSPLEELRKQLGHARISTTQTYYLRCVPELKLKLLQLVTSLEGAYNE